MSTDRVNGVDLQTLWGPSTLAAALASATTHLYVSTTTGSDANSGLSAASPKATLAGAYALLPLVLNAPYVIHLASGTYAHTPPPSHLQSGRSGFVVVVGDGAGQGADDGNTLVTTLTVAGGSTAAYAVVSSALTVDQYQGMTAEWTSGPAAGCKRTLNSNTGNAIYLSYPLVDTTGAQVNPATGQTVKITRPAVVLDLTPSVDGSGLSTLNTPWLAVHYVNVAYTASALPYAQASNRSGTVFFGVEIRGSAQLFMGSCATYLGVTGAWRNGGDFSELARQIYVALGKTAKPAQWEGWGLSTVGTTQTALFDTDNRAVVMGYVSTITQGFAGGGNESALWMLGGRCALATLFRPGKLILGGTNPIQIITNSAVPAIGYFTQYGNGYQVAIVGEVQITQNYDEHAIYLQTNVQMEVQSPLTITSAATGSFKAAICQGGNSHLHVWNTLTIAAPGCAAFWMENNASAMVIGNVSATQGRSSLVFHGARLLTMGAVSLAGYAGTALTTKDEGFVMFGQPVSFANTASTVPTLDLQGGVLMCRSTLTVSNSGAGVAVAVNVAGRGRLDVFSTLTITANLGPCLKVADVSEITLLAAAALTTSATTGFTIDLVQQARLYCANTITVTANFGVAVLRMSDQTTLEVEQLTAGSAAVGVILREMARAFFRTSLLISNCAGIALDMYGASKCHVGNRDVAGNCTLSAASLGAYVRGGCELTTGDLTNFNLTSTASAALVIEADGMVNTIKAINLTGVAASTIMGRLVSLGAGIAAGIGLVVQANGQVLATTYSASPSGVVRGLFLTDNAVVRFTSTLSIISTGTANALQGSGNARLFVGGAATVNCSGTAVPLFENGASQFSLGSTVTLINAGTGYAIELSDEAKLYAPATIGITSTVGPGAGFSVSDLAEIIAGGITANAPAGSRMRDGSRLVMRACSLTGAVNQPALALLGEVQCTLGSRDGASSVTLTASNPGSGAFNIAHGAKVLINTLATFQCNNTSTGASSDGIRIQTGGELIAVPSITVGTTGSSGYGVNCRGGGKFCCNAQPTTVVGVTADFSLGPNTGDDFGDEALAGSWASRTSGASVAYRGNA